MSSLWKERLSENKEYEKISFLKNKIINYYGQINLIYLEKIIINISKVKLGIALGLLG